MKGVLVLAGHVAGFFVVTAILLLAMVLALQAAAPDNEAALVIAILVALVVIIAAFVPFLNRAMRRAFVFPPAAATPVPEAELRRRLQALAERGAPVELIAQGGRMTFRWRYLDATLRGILEKQKLSEAYELQIRLDPGRSEAILTDVKRSLRLGAGASGVRLGAGFVRGWLAGAEIGRGYDIGTDLSLREAYDYRFSPGELKRPVLHTLSEAGWTARFAMW